MSKVDVTIVQTPIKVSFECPHCEEDINVDYIEIIALLGEPIDWMHEWIECPECNLMCKIDDVDWD